MSMENLPKKEIVVISAAAVASGIGAVALYILKRKRENKTVFVEGIDEKTADLFGVVSTHVDNEYLNKLLHQRYDGEPIKPNEEEQTE